MPPSCLSNQAQLLGLVFKAVRDQPSLQPSLPGCIPQPPCVCSPSHRLAQLRASDPPSTHLECALAPSPNTYARVYPEIHATLSSTPVQGPVQGPGHKHYPGCRFCLRGFHRQEWVDEGIDSYILIHSGPLASRNRNPFKVYQAKRGAYWKDMGFLRAPGQTAQLGLMGIGN